MSTAMRAVAVCAAIAVCAVRGADARVGGLSMMINQLAVFSDGNATAKSSPPPPPPPAPASVLPPPSPPASVLPPPPPPPPPSFPSAPPTKRAANGVAVLIFSTLSVMCALGACYVALFYDEPSTARRGHGGDDDDDIHDVDEWRTTSLREELSDFWRYARTQVAGATADGIVRVQKLTHRDENGDESWRRLSDTNPLVRWIKRHAGDAEEDNDSRGEPLIDEHDDDYYEMMSDHEAYSDFSEYLTSSAAQPRTPRTLDEAENANAEFVRLPPRATTDNL